MANDDYAYGLSVDALGVVTVTGYTFSTGFPMTNGAYDTIHTGGQYDTFVTRLDPREVGSAQLVYSTFLGAAGEDYAYGVSVDAFGVITVAGG